MEFIITFALLAAVALFFWAYPDQWAKAMNDIRDALNGGPPSSAA